MMRETSPPARPAHRELRIVSPANYRDQWAG